MTKGYDVSKKTKMGSYLFYLLSIIVIGVLFYSLFYIPKSELGFMKNVETHFSASRNDHIYVRDVTDFEWDTVCYVGQYWIPPFNVATLSQSQSISRWLKQDPQIFMGQIPNTYSPTYMGAYFFIKSGRIVRRFVYGTLGLRLTKEGIVPMVKMFHINHDRYLFIGPGNIANDACVNRDDAAFVRVSYPRNENRILLTNINLERER